MGEQRRERRRKMIRRAQGRELWHWKSVRRKEGDRKEEEEEKDGGGLNQWCSKRMWRQGKKKERKSIGKRKETKNVILCYFIWQTQKDRQELFKHSHIQLIIYRNRETSIKRTH